MQKKLEKQRAFFRSGRTIPLAFRKKALKRLGRAIRQHEKEIYAALREDLNKSKTETFMCEVGMTLAELSYMLKHLEGWAEKEICPQSIGAVFCYKLYGEGAVCVHLSCPPGITPSC